MADLGTWIRTVSIVRASLDFIHEFIKNLGLTFPTGITLGAYAGGSIGIEGGVKGTVTIVNATHLALTLPLCSALKAIINGLDAADTVLRFDHRKQLA